MRLGLIFSIIILLFSVKCSAKELVSCGGGFTDKDGITWDWECPNKDHTCFIEECCYSPRICDKCYSAVEVKSPKDEERCKNDINKYIKLP